MTQTITAQRKSALWRYCKLYSLICLFLLTGMAGLQAQNVLWGPGYPKLNPGTITVLDTTFVEMDFTVSANVSGVKVVFGTLPAGVTIAGNPVAMSGNNSPSLSRSGSTITLGNLTTSTSVKFRLPIYATCAVSGDITIPFTMQGSSVLTNGTINLTATTQKPAINVSIPTSVIDYGVDREKEYSINLSSANGNLNNFRMVLTVPKSAYLKDINLDGVAIPDNKITKTGSAAQGGIQAGVDTIYTVLFDNTWFKMKLGPTDKVLKLKAVSRTDCGSKTVTINAWYPSTVSQASWVTPIAAGSAACGSLGALPQFTMQMNPSVGAPAFQYTSHKYLAPHESVSKMCFDGTTTMYSEHVYKNIGTATGIIYGQDIRSYYSSFSYQLGASVLDVNEIYYKIDAGPETHIDLANIQVTYTLSDISRAVKEGYKNLPVLVRFSVPDPVPAGSTITYRVGRKYGEFYDPASPSLRTNGTLFTTNYGSINIPCPYSMSECGEEGERVSSSDLNYDLPLIQMIPPGISVRANEIGMTTVSGMMTGAYAMAPSNNGMTQSLDVYVQFPEWMTLDPVAISSGNALQWVNVNNETDVWESTFTQHNDSLFSIHVTSDKNTGNKYTNGILKVRYQTKTCPGNNKNVTDTVFYWINYNAFQEGTSADACRPTLHKIGQQFQPVTFLCKEDGVVLEDFYFRRTTKGYTDLDNDNDPNDGSIAGDDIIDHTMFVNKDYGYVTWKGHIAGTIGDTYTNMYALLTYDLAQLSSDGANRWFAPRADQMELYVNDVKQPAGSLVYTYKSASQCYLSYVGGSPLKGTDKVEIRMPFYCPDGSATTGQSGGFSGECFVSNLPSIDPFLAPQDRHGEDVLAQSVKIFRSGSYDVYMNATSQLYSSNNFREWNVVYWYDLRYLGSPWFLNEARILFAVHGTRLRIPDGYEFGSDVVKITFRYYDSKGGYKDETKQITATRISDTELNVDFDPLFDNTYNGSSPVENGKLKPLSDKFFIYLYPSTRATKGASQQAQIASQTLYYTDLRSNTDSEYSQDLSFRYLGTSTTLLSSTTALYASSPDLEIPALSIGNPNGADLNNVWLYVSGNVKDITLTSLDGGSNVTGTGYDGRWLKISDQLPAGGTAQYKFNATYRGGTDCSDAFSIYTVTGYGDNWSPNTGQAADLSDIDHTGAFRKINITVPSAGIGGSLSVSNPALSYNTPYTLTASLNSFAGQGALSDARMSITVPAGQQYQENSARIFYPSNGVGANVSAAFETELRQLNNDLTTDRTLNFAYSLATDNPDAMLPGTADIQEKKEVKLNLDFRPQCETALTGIRYLGEVFGTSACSTPAVNNGKKVYGETLYPGMSFDYEFKTTATIDNTTRVVGPVNKQVKFTLDLEKINGPDRNVNLTDKVELRMHKSLNLKSAAYADAANYGAVQTSSNTLSGDERIIRLDFNSTYYNTLPGRGLNSHVVYNLELEYDPAQYTVSDGPEQTISGVLITNAAFSPTCNPQYAASGVAGSMKVAVVVFDPYPTSVCPGTEHTAGITNSDGSTHSYEWFSDSGLSTPVGTGISVDYTSSTTPSSTSALYVRVKNASSVVLGTVNYQYSTYASSTVSITNPSAICVGNSVDLTASGITTATPASATLKYYTASNGTGELTGAGLSVSPGATTSYYVRATTTDGCKSAFEPIVVTVVTTPTVTKPSDVSKSAPGTINDIVFSGTNATSYSWTVAGDAIGLSAGSHASKIPSFTGTNAGVTNLTGTVTVTPHNTVSTTTCDGTSVDFTISVGPSISSGGFAPTAVCSGTTCSGISPTTGDNVAYYRWTGGSSLGLADNTTATDKTSIPSFTAGTVTSVSTATITVTPYTSGNVAGTPVTFVLTVNPLPTVSLSHNKETAGSACLNTDVTFTTQSGGGITDYVWAVDGASVTSGATSSSATAVLKWSTPGTKTVTVNYKNSNGCTAVASDESQVVVNPKPVSGTVSNSSVCTGLTHAAITPTGGSNVTYYTWSGGNNVGSSVGLSDYSGTDKTTIPSFTAASVTSATTATITVVPHYVNGSVTCDGDPETFTVTVNPLPVVTITDLVNGKVCVNTDITLSTQSGMKTNSYNWNDGSATTTTFGGGINSNYDQATYQWSTAGTYTVSVNYTDGNNCTATASTEKSITVLPATAITTQPEVDSAVKLLNGTIRPGENVALTVVAVGDNLTYQWYWKKASDGSVVTLTNGGKYSGTTAATFTVNNAYETENGDYYVTVTGTCNDDTSAPVTVVAVANQDASLKDLKINGVTLSDFNAAKTNYIYLSTCDEDQITIAGTPNNSNVTSITGNGTYSLNPGDNYLSITVLAQDMVTTRTYTVNVIRDCYVPKLTKDLEDAIVCVNDSHTFEVAVEGSGLTYEWYYGNSRILGANTNRYTIAHAKSSDYGQYYVIVRSNYSGYRASIYSKQVRLWVAEQLPETLKFANFPDRIETGKTYHLKLAGYSDVTEYVWRYTNDDVTFSPETGGVGENETWATFGTLSEGTGTVTATLTHPCGTREASRTIRVTYPTGVEDVTANQVAIYPNPTTGEIRISNTVANQVIRITDVTGSLKGSYRTQEGVTTIDLTGYPKGAYMVQYGGKTYKVIRK